MLISQSSVATLKSFISNPLAENALSQTAVFTWWLCSRLPAMSSSWPPIPKVSLGSEQDTCPLCFAMIQKYLGVFLSLLPKALLSPSTSVWATHCPSFFQSTNNLASPSSFMKIEANAFLSTCSPLTTLGAVNLHTDHSSTLASHLSSHFHNRDLHVTSASHFTFRFLTFSS